MCRYMYVCMYAFNFLSWSPLQFWLLNGTHITVHIYVHCTCRLYRLSLAVVRSSLPHGLKLPPSVSVRVRPYPVWLTTSRRWWTLTWMRGRSPLDQTSGEGPCFKIGHSTSSVISRFERFLECRSYMYM